LAVKKEVSLSWKDSLKELGREMKTLVISSLLFLGAFLLIAVAIYYVPLFITWIGG
jgi:hypothetical protein